MKTKKQTEKQELKYAPGDKVVYHCAGVDREGLIAYVDDTDNVAPYRINGMNIRESDIVEKVMKMRELMVKSMQAIANDCGLKA